MSGEIFKNDPRRLEMAAFANFNNRIDIVALINFDNELWASHSRNNEAMMARIRLQYWVDDYEADKPQSIITRNIRTINDNKQVSGAIHALLNAHIDYVECQSHQKKDSAQVIWKRYFELVFAYFDITDDLIASHCAEIFASANWGNFTKYSQYRNEINQFIKKNNPDLIYGIGFLKLCRRAKLFEDIIEIDNHKRLGILAKLAILGAVLFQKL